MGASAQPGAPAEIGFVRLLFTPEGVSVVEVSTQPGRLKPRRGALAAGGVPRGQVLVEAHVGDRAAHWADVIPDPLLERREYVNENGDLETLFIPRERAEVVVRVPAAGGLQTLTFSRGPASAGEDGAGGATWQVEVQL